MKNRKRDIWSPPGIEIDIDLLMDTPKPDEKSERLFAAFMESPAPNRRELRQKLFVVALLHAFPLDKP